VITQDFLGILGFSFNQVQP
jgi:CCR4-NOT transcription complex subunit 1